MPKEIIIFPFGGNARESLLSILAVNNIKKTWKVVAFIDDDRSQWGKTCCGIEVKGGRDILKKSPEAMVLAVPGNPDNYLRRKSIIESLGIERRRFATIIHPSVIVAADAKVGYNVTMLPNVFISCGAKIGNHCVILPNTVISHDTVIGDYSCVGSNVAISGNVSIGVGCYIGSGVNIRENISIGKGSFLGLGSNVISDIKEGVIAAGNPARVIRKAR